MFPSTGYFKAITCPFFSSGLCERQYCHFRHVKPTEPPPVPKDTSSSEANVKSQNGQSLLSMVGKAVQHFQKDMEKGMGHYMPKKKSKKNDVDPKMNKYLALIAGNEKYKMPETISIPDAPDHSSQTADPCVPQYKPTPISQLKKKQKPKYVVPYMEEDASESEYDPSTNFSTAKKAKPVPEFEYRPTPLNKKTNAKQLAESEYDPTRAEFDPTSDSEYEPSGECDETAEYQPTRIPNSELDECSDPEGNFSDDNDSTESAKRLAKKDKKNVKVRIEKTVEKPVKPKIVKDDLVSQIIFASDTTKSMSMSQVKKHSDGSIDFVSDKVTSKEKLLKSTKDKVTGQKTGKGIFDLFKKTEKKTSVKQVVSEKVKKSSDAVQTKVLERKNSGSLKDKDDKKVKEVVSASISKTQTESSKKIKSEKKERNSIDKHSSHSESPKHHQVDIKHQSDNASAGEKHRGKSQHSSKEPHSHHRSQSVPSKPHISKPSNEFKENGAKKSASSKESGRDSTVKDRTKDHSTSRDHKELTSSKQRHRNDSKENSHKESKSGSSKSSHTSPKLRSPGSYFGFDTDIHETVEETKSESKQSNKVAKTHTTRKPSHESNNFRFAEFDADFLETGNGNEVDKHKSHKVSKTHSRETSAIKRNNSGCEFGTDFLESGTCSKIDKHKSRTVTKTHTAREPSHKSKNVGFDEFDAEVLESPSKINQHKSSKVTKTHTARETSVKKSNNYSFDELEAEVLESASKVDKHKSSKVTKPHTARETNVKNNNYGFDDFDADFLETGSGSKFDKHKSLSSSKTHTRETSTIKRKNSGCDLLESGSKIDKHKSHTVTKTHSARFVDSAESDNFDSNFDLDFTETCNRIDKYKSHKITETRTAREKSTTVKNFDFDSDVAETKSRVGKHRKSSIETSQSHSRSKLKLPSGEAHTFYKQGKHSSSAEKLSGTSKGIKSSSSKGKCESRRDDYFDDDSELGEDELPPLHVEEVYKPFSWDDMVPSASHIKQNKKSKEHLPKSRKSSDVKVGSDAREPFVIISSSEESPKVKKTLKRSHSSSGSVSKPQKRSLSHVELFGDDSDDGSEDSVKFSAGQKLSQSYDRVRPKISESHTRIRQKSAETLSFHSNGAKRRKTFDNSSSGSDNEGDSFLSLGNDNMDVEDSDGGKASDARYGDSGEDLELGIDDDDDDDGEDLYDECLKIFNESPRKHQTSKTLKRKPRDEMEPKHSVDKSSRVAHSGAEKIVKKKPQRKHVLSPAEVMHNRFMEMQKKLEEAREKRMNQMKEKKTHESSGKHSDRPGSTLLKRTSQSSISTVVRRTSHEIPAEPEGPTRIQTIKSIKSGRREAHVPKLEIMKRPTIPTDFGSKIPTNIRQRYLNLFIDECMKINDSQKDAFERALSEEKAVYKRSGSKNVYLNVAVNAIKKLRNETKVEPESPSPAKNSRALSHEYNLGGRKAVETSYTLHRSSATKPKTIESFSASHLYHRLRQYILSEELLQENGFPCDDEDDPHLIKFHNTPRSKSTGKALEKVCTRCGEWFYLHSNGEWQTEDECVYHWGRAFQKRLCGSVESRYTCCDGDITTKGCQVAKLHVHDSNVREVLSGYVKTLPCSPQYDEDYGVYALDCEMLYTTKGQELARVTVIDHKSEAVYETFVKPEGEVIDHNTRFSGITEEDLKDTTTNIHDVQAVLLSLFNDKSILMGHSLESDFCALKLVHPTVVDTSVTFPHRMGPPFKRALRHLAGEILNKIIQNDVGGHDSHEDAAACLELMLWKVRDDIKKESR